MALPVSVAGGRYQVERFLGEGAKKRVYLAHDTRLERDVALALIKTDGLDDAGVARVRREARAMGRLGDHPHIVTVYDAGEEDGQTYIVSQYMAGGSVDDLLRNAQGHRLSLDQALRIADEICLALAHAHERGIVHRDLKPANVWLTRDGTAKLGDFGLALALDRSRLTVEGMMVGTVTYMPPEQALGRAPDGRSDLYGLGAMLYEMVTGRPPFLGDDVVAIVSQHINTSPVAPSWHNPEIPRALEALIMRLLAKVPEERPENAAAVRQALAAVSEAARAGQPPLEAQANPLDRLAGGVFVGREREMDELRAGLEEALSAHGRLLMLVGEPGIGKTRTAEELATYARLRKAQVLVGRCYESEGAPAYWPWIQIVRAYVHERDLAALMSELGSGAGEIARVVSEIRGRLPGVPEPPPLEPEQSRFRLFDSITQFLKNAAKNQPLLLILDDLHWADKPSLLLLRFLARELRGSRLLVLGTYRDEGLGRQHPLSQTLAELTREQLSHRIPLRGLSERDVSRFIELAAGLRPSEALVTAVYRETEGNPFFVNEVVRLLVTDGRLEQPQDVHLWTVAIPQGVREVIGRRLDHLSAECNRVLTTAAVVGREFGLDALERLTDLSGDRLLEALEEAVAARVVAEVPRAVGRYAFSHALIRETLYEELTTTRRARLHRQVGEVLETLYAANPEPHVAELAYHFFEAGQTGDIDKAIGYAIRAGNRAAASAGHEEAARHYEKAVQALELTETRDEERRGELLLTLGEFLWRAGLFNRAKEVFLQAADVARMLGDPEQLARAALGLGGRFSGFGAGRFDQRLVDLLEEALAALGEADSGLRAVVMARLAEALTFSPARKRRVALSRQAVEIARRDGDPAKLAYVLRSTHWALWGPDNLEERLAVATEMVQLADGVGDRVTAVEGRFWQFSNLLETGDVAAAKQAFEAAARLAEQTRQPYLQWAVETFRTMLALLEGRFEEAEQLAEQALKIGLRTQNQNAVLVFGGQMVSIRREQGRVQELDVGLQSLVDQYPLFPVFRCLLPWICAEMGRQADARKEFETIAANDFAALPRDFQWIAALVILADACAYLGDANRAAKLYELLLPYAARCAVYGVAAVCTGSLHRTLGHLAGTMSRWEEATRHFEAALEVNTRIGTRPWVAHTQHDYARTLLARGHPGDREKALGLLGGALDTAHALGMKGLVSKALALKLRAQGIEPGAFPASIDAVASAVQSERPDLRRHAAPDGTVTILFSDIEGSSAMAERLGDQRWLELLRIHNAMIRRELAVRHGYEVKTQGDGFMVAFSSARRALFCAIAIQRAFAAYNESHPEETMRVRIGLHTGEAIKDADDFFGKNVILAARIAAEAAGGEILVSSLVKQLTDSAGDIPFKGEREVVLKGLSGTHGVFAVGWS